MIGPLALLLSEKNTMVKKGAKQVLFDIVAKVSDASVSEADRQNVIMLLSKNLEEASSEYVKNYLEELKRMINY